MLFRSRRGAGDRLERGAPGQDENGRIVSFIHEDTPLLRRIAVFDVLVNNADRDHVLAMTGGHRYGVDHGLTFHSEHKLRTVLLRSAGQFPAPSGEMPAVPWPLF